MTQISPFTIVGVLLIVGVLIAVGIVVMLTPFAPQSQTSLPAGVRAQSEKYIETLGSQPFETLSTAQKLLVLHSYYNLQHYPLVIQYAETMTDALQRLAPERKAAFGEIIEASYQKLGKADEAMAFRHRIGN